MEINKFGTFQSTYKITTFLLCISMMYPLVKTLRRRLLGFAAMTLAFSPMMIILLFNTLESLLKLDALNLTHHTTVVGPYFGGLVKIVVSNYRSLEGQKIIAEIDRDYALYNTMPEKYHVIAKSWINNSLCFAEKCWNLIVSLSAITYLGITVFSNIKTQLFDDIPKRVPIHDALIPFTEPDKRFETPFFEMMFGQSVLGVFLVALYYLGFDSFMALTVNHACLKIEICCETLADALKNKNRKQRFMKIENVIKEQLRFFEFVETIQKFFNIYLGVVLFATLIQIGTCMYHIMENDEPDYQRIMITLVSVGAIYLPCYYASKLKLTAQHSAIKFYTSGWHKIYCINTRRIVLFMICRAQVPVLIMGFNFIVFDMQLFLSILQSAYSIYTLLTS